MFKKTDIFMKTIVFEVVENSLYQLESRCLTDEEKDKIVAIYNDFGFNDCPSVEDLKAVWDALYETL